MSGDVFISMGPGNPTYDKFKRKWLQIHGTEKDDQAREIARQFLSNLIDLLIVLVPGNAVILILKKLLEEYS